MFVHFCPEKVNERFYFWFELGGPDYPKVFVQILLPLSELANAILASLCQYTFVVGSPGSPINRPRMAYRTVMECFIISRHTQHLKIPSQRIVPMGNSLNKQTSYQANQTRRLEVLHNCVKFIFENKISDARKV